MCIDVLLWNWLNSEEEKNKTISTLDYVTIFDVTYKYKTFDIAKCLKFHFEKNVISSCEIHDSEFVYRHMEQ